MRMTRHELDEALRALEASIPTIKSLVRPEAQLAILSTDAFAIQGAAASADIEYVQCRLEKIYRSSGLSSAA